MFVILCVCIYFGELSIMQPHSWSRGEKCFWLRTKVYSALCEQNVAHFKSEFVRWINNNAGATTGFNGGKYLVKLKAYEKSGVKVNTVD